MQAKIVISRVLVSLFVFSGQMVFASAEAQPGDSCDFSTSKLRDQVKTDVQNDIGAALFSIGIDINKLEVSVTEVATTTEGVAFKIDGSVPSDLGVLKIRSLNFDLAAADLLYTGKIFAPRHDPDGRPKGENRCEAVASQGIVIQVFNATTGQEVYHLDAADYSAADL